MTIQTFNYVLDYYNSLLSSSPSSLFGYYIICIDILLFVLNIFQLSLLIMLITSVDAPLKKPITRLHYILLNYLHNDVPVVVHTTTGFLCAIIGYLWMNGWNSNGATEDEKYASARFIVAVYTLVCMIILRKITNLLIKLGPDRVLDIEQETLRHDMIHFQPPSKEIANAIISPVAALIRSEVTGIENVQQNEPSLFVMNHCLHGLEMGLFLNTVYQQKDIFLRGLADHIHFAMPHGEILRIFGAVDGTRENVDLLMKHKQNVLVYPGGGHEVLKHSSVPKYALMWKERLGFARMAIKHGYPIQPCAAVGTEDMLDIMFNIPVGFVRKDLFIPVTYPVSPNKLQKVYFWFGEPIPTKQYKGDYKNDAYAKEVRDKAKYAIENAIEQLKVKQSIDPDRFLMKQFANQLCDVQNVTFGIYENFWKKQGITAAEEDDDGKKKDE